MYNEIWDQSAPNNWMSIFVKLTSKPIVEINLVKGAPKLMVKLITEKTFASNFFLRLGDRRLKI
jgi:hypothetical protein